MGCPDATPDRPQPGSVEYLEAELLRAKQAVVAAKDAEYLKSARFIEDVDKLLSTCYTVPYGKPRPETIEEKIKASIEGAKRTSSALADEQWKPRRGTC